VGKVYKTNFHVPTYDYKITRYPGKPTTKPAVSSQCLKRKHFDQCPKLNCTCTCHVTGVAP
jgi:hypothetical protein